MLADGEAGGAEDGGGLVDSRAWGTAALYIEQGRGKPVRIYPTPGRGTGADLQAALVALRAAGQTATLHNDRITVKA